MSGGKRNQAMTGKTRSRPSRTKAASKIMKALHEAAHEALGKHTAEITKSLVDGAVAGKAASAKLLIDLAELQQPEEEDAKQNRRAWSLAEKLADEPEWRGDGTEADAEMDGGSREAEV